MVVRNMTIRKVTINEAKVHPRCIVVVVKVVVEMSVVGVVVGHGVALTVVVRDLILQSIVVNARVRLFALFVIGRYIRPINVSLILTALLTKVANRQQRQ